MFRVLVVEDEPPIMRAICTNIKNVNSGFSIEATAINGKKAIEVLQKQKIDIVFTDIRMPVMDGLVLAEWINKNQPDTLVVIASGYQDFEYARAAIEFKVFDYLLKPLAADKLAEVLKRAESEIKNRSKENKKEFLQSAARGNAREISEDNECILMLVCAGAYPVYGYDTFMPASRFWNEINAQELVESKLEAGESHIIFNSNSPSERFIVIETGDKGRSEIIAENIFDAICGRDVAVTVVYKCNIKMSETGAWFGRLSECLVKNLRLGISQIINCEAMEDEKEAKLPYSKTQIDNIISSAVNGENDKVLASLKDIFAAMQNIRATESDILTFLNLIADTCAIENPKVKGIKKELNTAVVGFSNYMSLADDAASILSGIKNNADKSEMSDRRVKLIDDVEKYLIKNYNKSITNDILSKEFGFVPSYISRIFRQGKGVSPSEYLIKYRIEIAKRLLSENSDLLVKEIADMVGFKEPYYFSKTFKKETGVWPSEYHG